MIVRLLYQILVQVLSRLTPFARSSAAKDAEILLLRHEVDDGCAGTCASSCASRG